MKKLGIIIIVAAVVFGAFNYHFILMDRSVKILKKANMSLDNTLVDARGANKYKLLLNPDLVKSGIKDLMPAK